MDRKLCDYPILVALVHRAKHMRYDVAPSSSGTWQLKAYVLEASWCHALGMALPTEADWMAIHD